MYDVMGLQQSPASTSMRQLPRPSLQPDDSPDSPRPAALSGAVPRCSEYMMALNYLSVFQDCSFP